MQIHANIVGYRSSSDHILEQEVKLGNINTSSQGKGLYYIRVQPVEVFYGCRDQVVEVIEDCPMPTHSGQVSLAILRRRYGYGLEGLKALVGLDNGSREMGSVADCI